MFSEYFSGVTNIHEGHPIENPEPRLLALAGEGRWAVSRLGEGQKGGTVYRFMRTDVCCESKNFKIYRRPDEFQNDEAALAVTTQAANGSGRGFRLAKWEPVVNLTARIEDIPGRNLLSAITELGKDPKGHEQAKKLLAQYRDTLEEHIGMLKSRVECRNFNTELEEVVIGEERFNVPAVYFEVRNFRYRGKVLPVVKMALRPVNVIVATPNSEGPVMYLVDLY